MANIIAVVDDHMVFTTVLSNLDDKIKARGTHLLFWDSRPSRIVNGTNNLTPLDLRNNLTLETTHYCSRACRPASRPGSDFHLTSGEGEIRNSSAGLAKPSIDDLVKRGKASRVIHLECALTSAELKNFGHFVRQTT